MFDIAPCAVSATRVVIAILGGHILARLLYSALYSKALHILICGDFGVDMVSLKNQRQRHCQYKKSDSTNRY